MTIHLLSGFLGSGKTTAIQQAVVALLQQGKIAGVITNDQGIRLVDGDFFKAQDIPGRQVVNGCFCCNYHQLDAGIDSLIEANKTEIIFAESVGSCTDIIATVVKPLAKARPGNRVTLSTFADVRLLKMILDGTPNSFNDTVNYIYCKQLEEAAIIVISKIDLVSDGELQTVKKLMNEKYRDKIKLYQNSLDQKSVAQWLDTIDNYKYPGELTSLDIDYAIYAAGEASMAWLDQELEVYSADSNALLQIESLINTIYQKINERGYGIGHLKFLVNNAIKLSFTSHTESPVQMEKQTQSYATLLLNIRVQTLPQNITQLIGEAIDEEEKKSGCRITVNSVSAFQPGYPRPAYRL